MPPAVRRLGHQNHGLSVSVSRRAVLSGAVALGGCGRKKGTGFRGHAIVALEESRAVAFVDLTAFAVRARVELKAAPSLVVDNPNLGSVYALLPSPPGLEEIDIQRHTVSRHVALKRAPLDMRVGRETWVLCSDSVVALDTGSFTAGRAIPLPATARSFDVSPMEPRAAVTLADGSLVMVDLATGAVTSRRKLSDDLGAVRFRNDGRYVLVADRGRRELTALDAATEATVVQLPLALRPDNLCMKPDGGQVFITGEGRDAIVIAYPYRTEIAQTSLSGRAPGAMAACESPDFLFVANPESGSVTIFAIDTQRVVAVTAVGSDPRQIVITPDHQYALVFNRGSGDMAVIRIPAIQAGRAKSAALFTMVPVGARPVSAVVRAG